MIKKKILIFPACSELGLEINRSIGNSEHFEIIGLSSGNDSNNGDFLYKYNYNGFPYISDHNFIDMLNDFIKIHSIDFIFPAHDLAVLELSRRRQQVNCEILASENTTCEICIDKLVTYKKFENIISVPKIYDDYRQISSYPVFLKPRIGHGSIGTHVVYSEQELDFYVSKDKDLICMEYLPGKEYTVDCFTNKRGELLFVGGRERKKIFAGMSSELVIVNNDNFIRFAEKINEELNLRGAWFFQLKENVHGELMLLEIEPRVSGGNAMFRNYGVNLPLMTVYDKLLYDIGLISNSFELVMNRTLDCKFITNLKFENVYVDFDGTLIINNSVNTQLMAFIYQCLNNSIKIHLITQHKNNLNKSLKKYRLNHIFDSIIWIDPLDNKADYINESNSIFIDNSYNHRYRVWKEKGIPVFDINSIECLIDYRRS